MEVRTILGFVVLVILLVIAYRYIMRDSHTMSGLVTGKSMQKIEATSITGSPNASNFSYSLWFYVQDWSYRYGEPKILFGRMLTDVVSNARSGKKVELGPCPSVSLAPSQNNIVVSVSVYPDLDDAPNATATQPNVTVHKCAIENIPLQKWVNVFVSVYGRTLDLYMDGKLVRTCVMPGVAKVDGNAPIYITPNGGFSGWTAKFQYWDKESDPQTVWNVYKLGYGGSLLGNLFGRYSVKVSVMDGDTEDTSWSI